MGRTIRWRRADRSCLRIRGPATRLHNNCSGKHAAMLARAERRAGEPPGTSTATIRCSWAALAVVAKWSGIDEREIGQAIDGCGVVEFSLPLQSMARAFARLAGAMHHGEDAAGRIYHAMRGRPFLIGGSDRFDSILIEETDGRAVSKIGAEGFAPAIPEQESGFANKSGGWAPACPAVIRMLQHFDVLPAKPPARLEEFSRRGIRHAGGRGGARPVADRRPPRLRNRNALLTTARLAGSGDIAELDDPTRMLVRVAPSSPQEQRVKPRRNGRREPSGATSLIELLLQIYLLRDSSCLNAFGVAPETSGSRRRSRQHPT